MRPLLIYRYVQLRGRAKSFEPFREMDEHTLIFQHNHRLCQCTTYGDLGVF